MNDMKNTLFEVNNPSVPEIGRTSQVRYQTVDNIVTQQKDDKFSRWVASHVLNTERLKVVLPWSVIALAVVLAFVLAWGVLIA